MVSELEMSLRSPWSWKGQIGSWLREHWGDLLTSAFIYLMHIWSYRIKICPRCRAKKSEIIYEKKMVLPVESRKLDSLQRKRLLLLFVSVSHSVVPDSLRPHGLQPTRLLCPWDFPGKDTGMGCHFLLQGCTKVIHKDEAILYKGLQHPQIVALRGEGSWNQSPLDMRDNCINISAKSGPFNFFLPKGATHSSLLNGSYLYVRLCLVF